MKRKFTIIVLLIILMAISVTGSTYATKSIKPQVDITSNSVSCHNGDSDALGNSVDVQTVISGASPQTSTGYGTASAYESIWGCPSPLYPSGLYSTVHTSYYSDSAYKPIGNGDSATISWSTGPGLTGYYFGVSGQFCGMSVSATSWLSGYCGS
ncbi:MAG: hypothetical protein GSR79_09205 [Desulfurococcales archaeon]|nr:hypothetical protein [Desulfurococcales archaeon]